jgi:plasmid stabilization system protein ParE
VTPEIRFEPEASDELDHAALWYQRRRPGLGFEFLDAVDRSVAMIRRWPHAAPLATDLPRDLIVRRAPVDQFPYRLVYLETPTAIRVLAVAHDSRRPNYWVNRIRE